MPADETPLRPGHGSRLPVATAMAAGLLLAAAGSAVAQGMPAPAAPPVPTGISAESGLRYGAEGEDAAFGVQVDDAGGIVVGGFLTLAMDASPAWLMRFDGNGLPEQSRLLQSGEVGSVYWLASLTDGGTLALGEAEVDGNYNAALWRLGPGGGLRWSLDPQTMPWGSSFSAAVELPGGDLMLGLNGHTPEDKPFVMALRTGPDGQERGRASIPELDDLSGMMARADGSLLAIGNRRSGDRIDIRLVTLAEDGSSTGHAVLQTDGRMSARRATPLPDGGIVMAAALQDGDEGPAAVLRIDASGEILWLRPIAEDPATLEDARPVRLPGGGTGIATVGSIARQDGHFDAFAGLLTLDGEWLWARRFHGPQDTGLFALAQRPGGGIVAVGEYFVPPPGAAAAGGEAGWEGEDDNWDAWIVTLSPDGAALPMTPPVADPALSALADELRLSLGQGFPGSLDLTDSSTPFFGPLGPLAFRQEGKALVMASAPFMAGPILLNASRSRVQPEPGHDRAAATTAWASPLLQVADEEGIANARVAHQRMDWSYRPGLLLADRMSLSLEGIAVAAPDGLQFAVKSITGEVTTEFMPGGRFDTVSSYRMDSLSALRGAPDGDPPFRLAMAGADARTELRGIDHAAYAAALRAEDPKAKTRILDTALRAAATFGIDGIAAERPEDDGLLAIALDGFGIDFAMERPAASAPVDLRLGYDLAGLTVAQDDVPLGALGQGRLQFSGTGWDLAALQAMAGGLEDADDDEIPAAAVQMLAKLDGLGLELSGREIMIDTGTGTGPARVGHVALGLAAGGIAHNSAEVELRLDGEGLHPGRQPGMPVTEDLVPRTLRATLRLGPLPLHDMAQAVLAGRDEDVAMLLAQAAPMLQIPRLAIRGAAGSLHGDGDFAVDLHSETMLSGQASLLVTRFERLSELIVQSIPGKGERAMAAAMTAYLAELGLDATDPEGRPALRFVVQTRPGGHFTVNGEAFPPGAGAGGGAGGGMGGDGDREGDGN